MNDGGYFNRQLTGLTMRVKETELFFAAQMAELVDAHGSGPCV